MAFSRLKAGSCTFVAGIVALGGAVTVQAQSADKSTWTGVYTDEQASRGQAAYAESCASCHGDSLAGIDVAPALIGAAFLNNWNNTSAGDLHTRIKQTMPLNAPDSLSGRTVADIEAYLFKANGFPSGTVALPPNPAMMGNIKIIAQKPAG